MSTIKFRKEWFSMIFIIYWTSYPVLQSFVGCQLFCCWFRLLEIQFRLFFDLIQVHFVQGRCILNAVCPIDPDFWEDCYILPFASTNAFSAFSIIISESVTLAYLNIPFMTIISFARYLIGPIPFVISNLSGRVCIKIKYSLIC